MAFFMAKTSKWRQSGDGQKISTCCRPTRNLNLPLDELLFIHTVRWILVIPPPTDGNVEPPISETLKDYSTPKISYSYHDDSRLSQHQEHSKGGTR